MHTIDTPPLLIHCFSSYAATCLLRYHASYIISIRYFRLFSISVTLYAREFAYVIITRAMSYCFDADCLFLPYVTANVVILIITLR